MMTAGAPVCSAPNRKCPWWQGASPQARSTADWDEVYASTRMTFHLVQPWGRNVAIESTLISEHPSAATAFAEMDRLSADMARTGAPSDAVELVVIDGAGRVLPRPGSQLTNQRAAKLRRWPPRSDSLRQCSTTSRVASLSRIIRMRARRTTRGGLVPERATCWPWPRTPAPHRRRQQNEAAAPRARRV